MLMEYEWQNCANEFSMLYHLRNRASRRKLLLWGCARFWGRYPAEEKVCIRIVERIADGKATERELEVLRERFRMVARLLDVPDFFSQDWLEIRLELGEPFDDFLRFPEPPGSKGCHLIRDIFANPFQPITFNLAWRTPDAIAIARAIYEERRFSEMPILADALEEAGCTSEEILSHCRNGKEHVRGCWVVDLILGKE